MKTSLCLILALGLAACASSSNQTTEPTSEATATPTAGASATAATAAPDATATAAPTATATPTASATAPADPAEANRKKAVVAASGLVSQIARGAVGAFEREQVGGKHALCKSAKAAVPAKVPQNGEAVKTDEKEWGGDDKTGWKCLKFVSVDPVPAQLSYTAGSTPKLLSRKKAAGDGDSFEVCAELDLTPGDKTTLICQMGKVDKKTNTVKLDTGLIVDNE